MQHLASTSPNSGWEAKLSLGFSQRGAKTVLSHRERKGPLVVQQPFSPDGKSCHVYLVHPPGGVVGGDHLTTHIDSGAFTNVLVTTPGATKFYRSAGNQAHQIQHLTVQNGALLQWLPLENIHFAGAQVKIKTVINLNLDGRVMLWDIHCFGRPACGEVFDAGTVDAALSIHRDDKIIFVERQHVDQNKINAPALMAGRAVTGTFIASHVTDAHLQQCRELMPEATDNPCGITRVDDLLIARFLGESTEQARGWFTQIWRLLQADMTGEPPPLPRIWRT